MTESRTVESCQKVIDEEEKLLEFFSQFKPFDYVRWEGQHRKMQRRHVKKEDVINMENGFNQNKHCRIRDYINESKALIKNQKELIKNIEYKASSEGKKETKKRSRRESINLFFGFLIILIILYLIS